VLGRRGQILYRHLDKLQMTNFLLRCSDHVNRVLTYAPYALLAALLAQALWMRSTLGRWPVVYTDEARGLVATALDASTVYLAVVILLGLPVWALSLLAVALLSGKRALLNRVVFFLGALSLLLAAQHWDVTGFMSWWLD
jgi:branched-subunit amino acid transport protein